MKFLFAAVALALIAPAAAFAQAPTAYPTKPIRYIVPFPAGASPDIVGRLMADRLSRIWGQQVVVDNRSGAGGTVGAGIAARAAPDGYTLLQGYVATHGTSPATRKVPYDPVRDFTAIGMIGATPNVLVVNSALPVGNVKYSFRVVGIVVVLGN